MKTLKKLVCVFVIFMGFTNAAQAGIPVIDVTAIKQQIAQVVAWGKQYQQMIEEFQQLEKEFNSMNGSRGMANLENNPAARKYMPDDYQSMLGGYGNSGAIRSASKVFDLSATGLNTNTDMGKAWEEGANQAAINRAAAEAAFKKASERFGSIQVLLEKVNDAPEAKDIADLQARIQAEQVMQQNEQTKVMMLAQLAQAQRDLLEQKNKEITLKQMQVPGNKNW